MPAERNVYGNVHEYAGGSDVYGNVFVWPAAIVSGRVVLLGTSLMPHDLVGTSEKRVTLVGT